MQVTEWIQPLKEQCIKIDLINKETYEKLVNDIAALIGYQYKLSNYMLGFLNTLKSKIPANYTAHYNPECLDFPTLTDHSRLVYNIANNFVDTILSILDYYGHQQFAQEIIEFHNLFLEKIKIRNAFLSEHPTILPPYTKTLDLNFHIAQTIPYGHNNDLTSYLGSLIKIIDNKLSSDFDKKYYPTIESISHIYQNIDNGSLLPQLEQICSDLDKTRLELLKEKSSLERGVQSTEDFLSNLPIEAIRENRQYSDYIKSTNKILPQIRANMNDLLYSYSSIPDIFKRLHLLFRESVPTNYVDQNEMEELRSKYIKFCSELKKLRLFLRIVKDSNIKQYSPNQAQLFISQEKDFLSNIKKLLEENNFQEIGPLIDNSLSSFAHYTDSVPDETEQFVKETSEFDVQTQRWANNRPQIDPQIEYQVKNLRDQLNSMQKQTDQIINSSNVSISQAIQSISDLMTYLRFSTPIKESELQEFSNELDREAGNAWARRRLESKREQIERKKKILEQKKRELEQQNNRISSMQKEIENYKSEKEKNPNYSAIPREEVQDAKDRALCPLCEQRNPRNCLLKECGHTFCLACIQAQIKSRNRACPSCNKKFAESYVKEIQWE